MEAGKLKFMENPVLETERIVLRKLKLSDDQDVFEYASKPEVARYVSWEAHKTIEETRKFIKFVMEKYEKDESGDWGVELKETGRVIGALGFVDFDDKNFCGTIGYVLSPNYWGMGIMTEAVKRLIRFGFEEMGLNRIEALYIPENEASGIVMQKAGMTYEGLLRQKFYDKGGFWDVKLHAILKKDYQRSNL